MESHLLQMRGLKPQYVNEMQQTEGMSHLLQMRGLKQKTGNRLGRNSSSHLLQMRGLKR